MKNYFYMLCVVLLLQGCEEFVAVDAPNHQLVSREVYAQEATARAALLGIYNQLYQAEFSAGWLGSVSVLAGISADELEPLSTNRADLMEFETHELLPDNPYNYGLWSSAYHVIYQCNAFLEGVAASSALGSAVKEELVAEALVIRAFTYFYLQELYGEVPLILGTGYAYNAQLPQASAEAVSAQIIADLQVAYAQLPEGAGSDKTRVGADVAAALLARVYLYQEEWALAEQYSSLLLDGGGYSLESDLDAVFLAHSSEALWQLNPETAGTGFTNTNEGSVLIIHPFLPSLSYVQLSEGVLAALPEEDLRRQHWVAYHSGVDGYYPYKYKIQNSMEPVTEYSMVMRLAEQYLIRAEARVRQGNLSGGLADVDVVRVRAGLEELAVLQPGISEEALLEEIFNERLRELFTEWGHRWLDLKRSGRAASVFEAGGSTWEATDVRYPIPEEERLANPNLGQNPGY